MADPHIPLSLQGRTAIVTGGARGIGRAIALRLASMGADVTITRHGEPRVTPVVEQEYLGDHEVDLWRGDLGVPDHCRHLVEDCVRRRGRLDILVNNASATGHAAIASLADHDDEMLERIVGVSFLGPFRCSREAARHMGAGGVIINIGSVAATVPQPNAAAYVASKAGLAGLTLSLAAELGQRGVRSVLVAPGDIEREGEPAVVAPIGRAGSPADVASLVGFLCSDDAGYITGVTIVIDGGLTASLFPSRPDA